MKYIKWLKGNSASGGADRKALLLLIAGTLIALSIAGAACSSAPATADRDPLSMEILKNTMDYIREHHPDAAAFIPANISFNQLPDDQRKVGYSRVTYTGGGWKVSIGHAITPDEIYDIRADYQSSNIVWIGRSQDSVIREDSYTKAE